MLVRFVHDLPFHHQIICVRLWRWCRQARVAVVILGRGRGSVHLLEHEHLQAVQAGADDAPLVAPPGHELDVADLGLERQLQLLEAVLRLERLLVRRAAGDLHAHEPHDGVAVLRGHLRELLEQGLVADALLLDLGAGVRDELRRGGGAGEEVLGGLDLLGGRLVDAAPARILGEDAGEFAFEDDAAEKAFEGFFELI